MAQPVLDTAMFMKGSRQKRRKRARGVAARVLWDRCGEGDGHGDGEGAGEGRGVNMYGNMYGNVFQMELATNKQGDSKQPATCMIYQRGWGDSEHSRGGWTTSRGTVPRHGSRPPLWHGYRLGEIPLDIWRQRCAKKYGKKEATTILKKGQKRKRELGNARMVPPRRLGTATSNF